MANGSQSQLTHHEVDILNRKHRQTDCSRVIAKSLAIEVRALGQSAIGSSEWKLSRLTLALLVTAPHKGKSDANL